MGNNRPHVDLTDSYRPPVKEEAKKPEKRQLSLTEYCKHEMIEAFCADCRGLELPAEVFMDDELGHLTGQRAEPDFSKPQWLSTLDEKENKDA